MPSNVVGYNQHDGKEVSKESGDNDAVLPHPTPLAAAQRRQKALSDRQKALSDHSADIPALGLGDGIATLVSCVARDLHGDVRSCTHWSVKYLIV